LFLFLISGSLNIGESADELKVRGVLSQFLSAVTQRDVIRLRSVWADDPVMFLEPKDLRVDFVSPDVAVVTFHLTTNPQSISRRLFVLARKVGQWKITHLHASDMPLAAAR